MAYVFELSKVEIPAIRERMVANLRNADEDLAAAVADGLGIDLPEATEPAVPPRHDLPPSPALSMTSRAPKSFAGRKLGVLVSDDTDPDLLGAVTGAVEGVGGTVETIGLRVGGVRLKGKRARTPVDHKIDGAPSVLFDAVALLAAGECATELARHPAVKDFVSDAFSHYKHIGYVEGAQPLLSVAGVAGKLDQACHDLGSVEPEAFVAALASLRRWERDV